MPAQSNAPVIIKRKKVVSGHGHHGGAWKVAYADFVTAMMAFFMLMWLLGATTEKQRKGIADYFNPTIPVVRASGGGSGAFGGDSVFSEEALSQSGTGAGVVRPTDERRARGDLGVDTDAKDDSASPPTPRTELLDDVNAALLGVGGESLVSELLRRHVVTRLSDEGVVIELFDTPGNALFDNTGAATDVLQGLLEAIAPVLELVVNDIAVQAHTRAVPVVRRQDPTWSQSTERADAARLQLLRAGVAPSRVIRVTGYADSRPVTADPMAPRNDRVEIVVLRGGP